METFSKRLLGAVALVLSTGMVEASTNKTFMMPRPTGVDLPMEVTTYHRFHSVAKKRKNHLRGAEFQVTGFYSDSASDHALGRYFGINNKATIDLGANDKSNQTSDVKTINKDIDLYYMLHWYNFDKADDFNAAKNTFSLRPDQESYGLRLDFYKNCDRIISGLYWYANMPLVHIKQDMHETSFFTSGYSESKGYLQKYFAGTFLGGDTTHNLQEKLTHAKYTGRQTEIGIADIDLALGYKFFNTKEYDLAFAVALTIPTGNKPTGEYLFESIVGNGHHFALGADLHGQYTLWGNREHNLKANMYGKFRYLFESNEKRTLSLRRPNGTVIDWGQYYLLGKNSETDGQPLIPAANILTQNVDVRPGAQFDGVLGLQYNYRCFVFDLGYNFYGRETEKVALRDTIEEDMYAIAARDFNTENAFALTNNNVDGGNAIAGTITSDQANKTKTTIFAPVAATGYQITHSIYGSLGYIAKKMTYPIFVGVGGKYEWKEENNAIEKWELWAKLGVGF